MKIINIARHIETSKVGRPAGNPGSGLEPGQIGTEVRPKREKMTDYPKLFAGNCGYLRVFAGLANFSRRASFYGEGGVVFGNLEFIMVDSECQNL